MAKPTLRQFLWQLLTFPAHQIAPTWLIALPAAHTQSSFSFNLANGFAIGSGIGIEYSCPDSWLGLWRHCQSPNSVPILDTARVTHALSNCSVSIWRRRLQFVFIVIVLVLSYVLWHVVRLLPQRRRQQQRQQQRRRRNCCHLLLVICCLLYAVGRRGSKGSRGRSSRSPSCQRVRAAFNEGVATAVQGAKGGVAPCELDKCRRQTAYPH